MREEWRDGTTNRDLMKYTLPIILALLAASAVQPGTALATKPESNKRMLDITLACAPVNDLYVALIQSGYSCRRYGTAAEAFDRAPAGSAVMLLADRFRDTPMAETSESINDRRTIGHKFYLEHDAAVNSRVAVDSRILKWERVVVSSERFAPALPQFRILMLPDCRLVKLSSGLPLLELARVAGFDTAVYGLPEQALPLLVDHTNPRRGRRDLTIEAATSLSQFRRGRFLPSRDWATLWERLLTLMCPNGPAIKLNVSPAVRPAYSEADKLPRDVERRALRRGMNWYRNSGLLVSPSHVDEVAIALRAGKSVLPSLAKTAGADGSHGILEGFSSTVHSDGSQDPLIALRADCCAEAAMVFALNAYLNKSKTGDPIARNLLDYVFTTMQSGVRGDPKHPAFGLIAWGAVATAWETANYGDDNARTILAALVAGSASGSDRWDKPLLRALLANLRTTGTLGFRGDRIDIPALEKNGWRHYHESATVNYSPHFEAYLWACYLWAYQRTIYAPFLDRVKTAIRMTMDAYPDGWRWKDSVERAHMLLPLAWLVRVEDTPEHREWLSRVAGDLLKTQQPCGALREVFAGGGGHLHAPASNEAYGTGEAPLAQVNGDPVSDQLYTTGFALLGLHEAAAATGDPRYRNAENRLAEYLCRIQVRSTDYPFLDGAWFRAFDYSRWDYWGSAADFGWGPWNAESGWGPAWINAVLALRAKKTSCWEFTAKSRIAEQLDTVQKEMEVATPARFPALSPE